MDLRWTWEGPEMDLGWSADDDDDDDGDDDDYDDDDDDDELSPGSFVVGTVDFRENAKF